MQIAPLTALGNYFESFEVGQVIRHARGKTVEALENVLLTHLVMNTAATHFDAHAMQGTKFGQRAVFGGVTGALVLGLASQDTAENALAELTMTGMRLKSPVFHGDTLYAYSEVVAKADSDRPDAGLVTFKHWGVNQQDVLVFECQRTALIKRSAHWGTR